MKTVNSEVIENLCYLIQYNGFTRTVIADVGHLKAGTAYSPIELFPEDPIALAATMEEGARLAKANYYKGVKADLCYKLGRESACKALESLAMLNPEEFLLWMIKCPQGDFTVYLKTEAEAKALADHLYGTANKYGDRITTAAEAQMTRRRIFTTLNGADNKEVFRIPDAGREKDPVSLLDFYRWLTANPDAGHHRIDTPRRYLREIGFKGYAHKLTPEDLALLKCVIELHYIHNRK